MTEKVTILGAGHQGLTMAAHLSDNGVECYLWNRTAEHIEVIKKNKEIICSGLIEKKVQVRKVSTDLRDVLQKIIMVATPSSAHRDLAMALAPYVDDSYTIILNPGRTFGILDFIYTLKRAGCKSMPCIAETQTIIYTCRRSGANIVKLFALKNGVRISTLNYRDLPRVMSAIPKCIRDNFIPEKNYMVTSLSNVGMVLHCAPVLMNIGWIENDQTKFEYYYDGISRSIANVLEKIDMERITTARAMGVNVESTIEWLHRIYQTKGNNLFEHLQSNVYYRGIDAPQSIHHRYIEEDVPNGLVALESLGNYVNIPTPAVSSVISMANIVMNCDYRKVGRNYSKLKSVEKLFF